MPVADKSLAALTPRSSLTRILSLPRGLLQSILDSVSDFKPWVYTSTLEQASTPTTDEELWLYTPESMPHSLITTNRTILGLSSTHRWPMLILSQHSYHLSRNDKDSVSLAIMQALRRMNARIERKHWDGKNSKTVPQVCGRVQNDESLSRTLDNAPMLHFRARIQTEEEACSDESPLIQSAVRSISNKPSHATALVLYKSTPILRLTNRDAAWLMNQQETVKLTKRIAALFVAILVTLVQCRLLLLEILEKLECDTPILSIEPGESKDFAASKMSPHPDRMRSLSGSTVADLPSHTEMLSFSTISTVFNSEANIKEVRWADKRASEEKDIGTSPKRPKLNVCEQVSSGRVATLMNRFENLHL